MGVLGLALLACKGDDPVYTEDTADTYVGWPEDTDVGTDEDGDGWTIEDGDCDDADIYVHPGWAETEEEDNIADGKDNDCDGRTDEDFLGIVAVQQGNADGGTGPLMVGINDFGETEWEVALTDTAIVPYFMTWGVNGGWVVGTLGATDGRDEQVALYEVSESGVVTLLADFSDPDLWPFALWGITTHPDGYYIATAGYKVVAVEPGTGAVTTMWETTINEDFGLPDAAYPFDVFVDYATHEIGVFGLYGSFITLDPDSWEATDHRTYVLAEVAEVGYFEYQMWSGTHWDGGGWYAGGYDATSGVWNVYRFKETDGTWAAKASFDEPWQPRFLTLDAATERGGYYISSTTGQYPIIWKVGEDGEPPSQWFESEHSGPYFQQLWDLYTVY